MRPLILITNDDGVAAKGLATLEAVACEFGDVVVMAPGTNASGKGMSLTTERPLRAKEVRQGEGISVYACDGTPVDCVKLAVEHFCPRKPDLVLSGINHGSNSSINVLYSGTMGAVIEASVMGFSAIGFSLLNHNPEADFSACVPYVRHIVGRVLEHGLPADVSLNVNIPRMAEGEIKGLRVCQEAKALWTDSFEKRIDPIGRPYYWLTGKFVCNDPPAQSDETALKEGYVSVVPIHADYTHYGAIEQVNNILQ
ncbi:MAG: 5'/3'-nucleotidase SurE [Bacteroidales bacterium]|nr:5'/3'-nucleotidase SurE [Bacteroidales bacterium]